VRKRLRRRDRQEVALDLLAAMAEFHGEGRLADAYAALYQALGPSLILGEPAPEEKVREVLARLPEPDQEFLVWLMAWAIGGGA